MAEVINTNNFSEKIGTGISLVDFYADWCGPCQVVGPILEEMAESRDDAGIYKMDVDASGEIAAEYGVLSIPTVIIFKDGVEQSRITGVADATKYNEEIDKLK